MSTFTTDPAGDAVLLALTEVIKGATSPEIQRAQAMLLRRLASQGDIIPSRIPAPRNVTEVGGYFNLLTTLNESAMRQEMLGAALGLATNPLEGGGMLPTVPPMKLTALVNDRPDGAARDTVPLSVAVREDLAAGLLAAVATVHAGAGLLPLWSPPVALPGPTGAAGPYPNPLPHLGREIWVAPTAATVDPATDPVVVGRTATDAGTGYRVGIRVADGTPGAPKVGWIGLVWDTIGQAYVERDLGQASLLPLAALVADTSFRTYPLSSAPVGRADYTWARLTGVAGLIPGVSRLGDELRLVWTAEQVAVSAYAGHESAIWDGTAFVG